MPQAVLGGVAAALRQVVRNRTREARDMRGVVRKQKTLQGQTASR
jgi:hypothetical protein